MIKELFVLKLFTKDKNHYDKYYTFLSTTNLDSEIKLLFSLIDSYYTDYPEHKYIGSSELINYFQLEYSSYKDSESIIKVIEEVYRLEVSDSLIRDYLQQMLEKDTSTKIINKLLQVVDESKAGQLLTVKEDIAKYEELIKVNKQSDSIFVSNDLDELIEQEYEGDAINWRLKCLQEAAGPVREGLYHVAARPETGKTSFLASEATNFATQIKDDESIIWFNNEEAGNRVQLRLFSTMLNTPIYDIISNKEQAKAEFIRRGGNRIKLYDNAYISIEDIDRICNEYNPRIIISDIADKVTFRGSAHLDGPIRLKELYRKFRELSKIHKCAIITAGQASAEAHGKKWLELIHLDYSRTGKGGELDLSIGIGKCLDDGKENMRYIHLNKNKFTGLEIKTPVLLNPFTGRYSDME